MKKINIVIGIVALMMAFTLVGCNRENTNNVENSGEQIKSDEQINSGEYINTVENVDTLNEDKKLDAELVKAYTDIINTAEAEALNGTLRYELVYFNNDDIPDLVVGNPGYWVSLHLYHNGKVYNPIEKWAYGAMGNHGYDYEEKSGVIVNSNTDFAGAIMTVSTNILNSNFEFETFSVTSAGSEISEDDLQYQDILNALETYGGHYYNDEKVSEEEYTSKINMLLPEVTTGVTKILEGSKTAEELKTELEKIIV